MSSIFNNGLFQVLEPRYKDIKGKPSIIVSAKGIANGLSNTPNDGADFGVDTTLGATSPSQTGSPYTQTSGWQEAIKYAESNNILKIESNNGSFYSLSNPIYLNPDGIFNSPLEINGNNSTIQISSSNLATDIFKISVNTGSSGQLLYPLKIYGFVFDGNGSSTNTGIIRLNQYGYAGNNPDYIVEIYGNKFMNGSLSFISVEQQSYTLSIHDNIFENVSINTVIGINGQNDNCTAFIYANNFIAGALSTGSNAILLNNNNTSTTISSPLNSAIIFGNYFSNTSDASSSSTSSVIVFGGINGAGWNGCIIEGNVFNLTAGWTEVIEQASTGAYNISIIGNTFYTRFTISVDDTTFYDNMLYNGITIYGNAIVSENRIYLQPNQTGINCIGVITNNNQQVSIVDNVITDTNLSGSALAFNNTSITGSSYIVANNLFNGETISINQYPVGLILLQNKTSSGVYPLVPTTPAVPTSGTAQQNTNPYPVNVYLYGGTVTEIQLTRNGTAYTVFSNASGLALSGQVYKLNPSDSITVTYSTAPTWEWLSD